MLNVLKMKKLVKEFLINSDDLDESHYSYILFLMRSGEDSFKTYQLCLQEDKDKRYVYVCEYNPFSNKFGDGKSWDLEKFNGYIKNEEVCLISEIKQGWLWNDLMRKG